MQVRWNYKLQPNKGQQDLASEWLVTLRKHRNYSLRERENGYYSNNLDADQPIAYSYGSYCDIETRVEYGVTCPLTCAVVKHGVVPAKVNDSQLVKVTKAKTVKDKKTGKMSDIPSKTVWDTASGIQSKRTTQLRGENLFYSRIDSDVLQSNLAKLDAAFSGFWKHERGFPAYRKASNFNSFQYKPSRVKFEINQNAKIVKVGRNKGKRKNCYSHVYLPGLGTMRFLDSRLIPETADIRTVTVMKEADGWYMSVLLDLPEQLPNIEERVINSTVGIDLGINKLVSLSDGSFIENPRFATNKKTVRRMRIRQRRVNRKLKGSKNRFKAGKVVARMHKKIADQRNDYQWKAAHKIVKTADAVIHEDLNIKAMKARCKVKRDGKGRAMKNGQSAKRGLNRSISDASWGEILKKTGWIGAKAGKPVVAVNPRFTSQECSSCGHISKHNRDGEKFICENCGHIDHADTQASRTIGKRAEFKFTKNVRKDVKILPTDCGKVTRNRFMIPPKGKRDQVANRTSKAKPENRILSVQLNLFDQESPSL